MLVRHMAGLTGRERMTFLELQDARHDEDEKRGEVAEAGRSGEARVRRDRPWARSYPRVACSMECGAGSLVYRSRAADLGG
jgi:hypothetical protein